METQNKIAFVAMKFDDDHWRDKRYLAIAEVLEEAGYQTIRADQIKTSGPVVEEVCRLFHEADLVVIDSSGDSHSVSYEVGYCHGIGRSHGKTILLRNDPAIPFNYRHFRHKIYKDLKSLKRLLRDCLNIIIPLADSQLGGVFTYEFAEDSGFYGSAMSESIVSALRKMGFTGRAEAYFREHFGLGNLASLALGLRFAPKGNTPTHGWWTSLAKQVAEEAKSFADIIVFSDHDFEITEIQSIRSDMRHCGAAQLEAGEITQLLGDSPDGYFSIYLADKKSDQSSEKGSGVAGP